MDDTIIYKAKNKGIIDVGWALIVFFCWMLIFGIYEIVERVWLKNASLSLLHTLHIIRGTTTSFVLASIVALYYSKIIAKNEKIKMTVAEPSYMKELDISLTKELFNRSLWLIRLRWIAIIGVIIAAVIARYLIKILPEESIKPLFVIVFFMILYNVIFLHSVKKLRFPRAIAFSQVFLDLISLTLFLHFSGGAENPFFAFFVFHIIISGILLEKEESYFVSTVACILFTLMVLCEYFGVIKHYSLGILPITRFSYLLGLLSAFVATSFFSAYFVTTIMENLHKRELEIRETLGLLAQEKGKLNDIIQSIGAGLSVLDKNYNIIWENEKIKEWTTFTDLRKEIQDKSKDGKVLDGSVFCYEKDYKSGGHTKYFMITLSPIKDLSGTPTHILGLVQDITQRKEIEIQLLQSGKMIAVGQLAAGIAHEINNPLATVAASTELLLDIAQNETLRQLSEFAPFPKHLKRIDEHIFRCKDIITSLLGFARKEDEEFTLTDVNLIISDSVKLLSGYAGKYNKTIQVESSEIPYIRTHPKRLEQVFINIIMNALEAIEEKGCVKIRTYKNNGLINIEFEDNGTGISEENLQRIFDPFFTNKPLGKGTGLGLYLCHQIISNIKGSIEVTSELGKGSTFTVEFPI